MTSLLLADDARAKQRRVNRNESQSYDLTTRFDALYLLDSGSFD